MFLSLSSGMITILDLRSAVIIINQLAIINKYLNVIRWSGGWPWMSCRWYEMGTAPRSSLPPWTTMESLTTWQHTTSCALTLRSTSSTTRCTDQIKKVNQNLSYWNIQLKTCHYLNYFDLRMWTSSNCFWIDGTIGCWSRVSTPSTIF